MAKVSSGAFKDFQKEHIFGHTGLVLPGLLKALAFRSTTLGWGGGVVNE